MPDVIQAEAEAQTSQASTGAAQVRLRKFPYPFRAALAICSDIDCVDTVDEFLEIQRFLNTKEPTSMGDGVGLEIGNSFYFYDREGGFSFFGPDERSKRVILDLARAGYLDCIHSFGNGATTRQQIEEALEVLERENCRLKVWVNHHGAPSNIMQKFDYMLGKSGGDDPRSPVYHTDLTLPYGIRYAWGGAVTRFVGQSAGSPASRLTTTWDRQHPVTSLRDAAMEVRKTGLGIRGDARYQLHASNRLTQVTTLRDGQKVHEFQRYCAHPRGISFGATSAGLEYAISPRVLGTLKATGGYSIVYTHLGKNDGCRDVIAEGTQEALRNLEQEYRSGQIYVTTTFKLLEFRLATRHLVWSTAHDREGTGLRILIKGIDDPAFGLLDATADRLQGLTFYVPDSLQTEVIASDGMVRGLLRNPPDESGMESVTIPFIRLSFPDDRW